MKVTSLFSLFLSFAVLRAAEYAWNLTETEWKAIQRSRLPRQHLSFNGLAPTRKKLLEEHGCRYNLSDTIIKLKPGSELTTSEHARFAQKTHDQSTEKGIGSWCKGVQTNFPIRDVEWYYHGCFALDALDLIEQHPDTWGLTPGVDECDLPFRQTEAEAAKWQLHDNWDEEDADGEWGW